MPSAPFPGARALPRWLIAVGSAVIVFHFAAVLIPILDTPSGPWATPMGRTAAEAPSFAHEAASLANFHGDFLRVVHSYHFVTNRPADIPGVQFEVVLRDKDGTVMKTLAFPDPGANPWVRQRQEILASSLAPDLPAEKPASDIVAPPGQKPPMVDVWALPGETFTANASPPPAAPNDRKSALHLERVPQHRVPRYRDSWRPSEWSLVLAHSYARFLCRENNAASAEIIRHTREPVGPDVLMGGDTVDLSEIIASFGEKSE
jgi:hypothetical protein